MKNLIFILFIFFLNLEVLGQNGLLNGKLFLLLKDNKSISINSFENKKIKEIKTFTISDKSIYTTDQKERVAILDTSKNNITIFDINSTKKINFSIPFQIKPKTILLNKDNLFVGGQMGNEMLVQYHIKNEKWYSLEIPDSISLYGKAIDDLVVNDSALIAIDNLIIPKYILFYKLNSIDKLKFSHLRELKSNSSYESIHQARITSKYLGLISTTMNHGSISEHITLYADLDLLKSFALSIDFDGKNSFKDLLIIEDKLFIVHSTKGLGVFKIKDSYFKKSENEYDTFNTSVSERFVKYKKYKKEEIIKLTKTPNDPKIILTIKNTFGKIRNEIINL